MSEPFVGKPVRFHLKSGEVRPATVTRIHPDGSVNLQVIPDCGDAVEFGVTRGTVPMMGVSCGSEAGQWSAFPG